MLEMKKVLIFAVVALMAAVSLAVDFKAGYAVRDITPPLGSTMPGYYIIRNAKDVLDPLQIVCVAFSDGAKTAFVFQVDSETVKDNVVEMMKDAITAATGCERDAIIIHGSHTHDGGPLMKVGRDKRRSEADNDRVQRLAEVYINMAVTRAADAAVEAMRDLKPAKLSYQRTQAKRISFGRRYLMKDGKVRTNPGTNNPDIVKPVGTADDTEQIVRIDREGGEAIVIINFQTHPDVVGGEHLTADWPGLTRHIFEAATLGKAKCIVFNGTQGDVNHCNVMPKPGELNGLTRDFDDVDRGYDHAIHMANVLAGNALAVWMKCIPMEAGEIRYGKADVRVPAQKAKDTDEKNLAWAEKVWATHEAGRDEELPWKGMELTTEVARAGRIKNVAKGPDYFDLPISGLAIGRSLAFGGFPGEPFNDIGVAVRKDSPFTMTILSCLTNGSRGYFPFSDSYEQGGYESATSPFGPSVADDLIAGQVKLLKSLYK